MAFHSSFDSHTLVISYEGCHLYHFQKTLVASQNRIVYCEASENTVEVLHRSLQSLFDSRRDDCMEKSRTAAHVMLKCTKKNDEILKLCNDWAYFSST